MRLKRHESVLQTRERLLNSARIIFAQNGFGGASVDAIAAAAGYSKGAIYSNFTTKEELFLTVLAGHMQAELEATAAMVASGASVDEIIDRVADRYATDQEDSTWSMLSIEFALHAARSPQFAKAYVALFERQYDGIVKIIDAIAAQMDRSIPRAREAAITFVALRQGLALEQSLPNPGLTKSDVRDALRNWIHSLLESGKSRMISS
jgi:TetR/AcrR family transcriptional regulator, transcriptional repressor of aconitase